MIVCNNDGVWSEAGAIWPAYEGCGTVVRVARQAVEEIRGALTSLRSSTPNRNDMAEALWRAGEEFHSQRRLSSFSRCAAKLVRCIRLCAMRCIELDVRRSESPASIPRVAG